MQAAAPPKDGMGPRGAPDCYYTSRVLNSTARYGRFVKKLRALEEEQRRGRDNSLKEAKDQLCNDFFVKCDRRSLINTVAHRVDICLASYEEHLNEKRMRLKELLSQEEELNIHKFVEQAQDGAAAAWHDKEQRLAVLQEKRRQEHREKYAATPLSKCSHVTPCLVKQRAQEVQQVLQAQTRERQQRRAAARELDAMWHHVAMREADALAARLELDAMERRRRDAECARHTREQLAQRELRRAEERGRLRDEALAMRAQLDRWERERADEKLEIQEKGKQIAEERRKAVEERQEVLAQQRREAALVQDAWDSLRVQDARGLRRLQQERDLDECNRKMAALKHSAAQHRDSSEPLILREGRRLQDARDLHRCLDRKAKQRATKENSEAVKQQLREQSKSREEAQQRALEQEYQQQLDRQLQQLEAHQRQQQAYDSRRHQADLLQQIKYNQLLKERALQEEMEQRTKCQLAQRQYQEDIKAMLSRPFYSDKVHPFTRVMAAAASGLPVEDKCPCSPADSDTTNIVNY